MNNLVYDVESKPTGWKLFVFSFQQVMAVLAATITVPILIGLSGHISAAILGCGIGTITYILFTRKKSPVILSSSFAYISALTIAYAKYGFLGIIIGSTLAGLVYVIIALIIKKFGTGWLEKLLPPIIIGPVVALIGLTLAPSAIANLVSANGYVTSTGAHPYNLVAILCGITAFIVVIICTTQNKSKNIQLLPFLVGIGCGYVLAAIFTLIGSLANVPYLMVIDFSPIVNNFKEVSFASFLNYPRVALIEGIKEIADGNSKINGIAVLELALAFMPIALVSFSEHVADHKNLSSIIGRDLVNEEPGLSNTLLGDGIGSITGTIFGICPNTTYGESIACVAITKNASIRTTMLAALMCIVLSFISPIIVTLQSIPSCVMGGVCLVLYGFISVSGLRMISGLDISGGKNLFTLSVILICGIGGLALQIPYQFGLIDEASNLYGVVKFIEVGAIAFALIMGIITYNLVGAIEKRNQKAEPEQKAQEEAPQEQAE